MKDLMEKNSGGSLVENVSRVKKFKIYLLLTAIVAILLIVSVLLVNMKLRRDAEQKVRGDYESTIADLNSEISNLEKEIEVLQNPIVSYSIASADVVCEVIEKELNSASELATMEYWYTDAAKFTDVDKAKIFKHEIAIGITEKNFTMKWEGTIKAGVDVSQIETEVKTIDESSGIITFTIPKAKILSHEIDESTCEVLNEKDGLFNRVTVADDIELRKISKAAMETRAIENGILEKAQKQVEIVLNNLLYTAHESLEGYTVEFQFVE